MSASAIIPATGAGGGLVLKVEEARALLKQATQVDEVKEIHDKAKALETYYRQQDAALGAQQDAGVVRLMAGRRIGELLGEQAARGERQGRGDAGRAAANAPKAGPGPLVDPAPPATLKDLGIERHQAQTFQQLAKVPDEKFDGYVAAAKKSRTEITTAGLLNHASKRNPHAASNVNSARAPDAPPTEPDKNDRFTERAWVQELKDEFGLTRDYAGHPLAPATEIFGREHVYTVEDDCFLQEWTEAGLLNPPWDQLPRFVVFGWLKVATGECPRLVLPLPGTRWEQDWAKYFVHPFRPDEGGSGARIRFPHGRKGYGTVLDPEGDRPDNNVGLPSAELILEGPFVRSQDARWKPTEGIDEVIAAQRFGEDKGLAHLWKQALQLARGEAAPSLDRRTSPSLDRRTFGGARRALVAATLNDLTAERFKGEAINLGFSASRVESELRLRCLARKCPMRSVFTLDSAGRVEHSAEQLAHLRKHSRSHAGAKSKKRGKR